MVEALRFGKICEADKDRKRKDKEQVLIGKAKKDDKSSKGKTDIK